MDPTGLSIPGLLKLIQDAGTVGLLVLLVFAFLRGWIVPKWAYDAKVEECTAWKAIVDGSLDSVKQLVELAELVEPRRRQRQ